MENTEARMHFSIVGKSALLVHNPASMKRPGSQQPTHGPTIVPTPEVEAENGLYVDDGKYCIPGIGVRNGLIKVAGDWKPLSGKKRGTLTSTIAHIVVEPELVPILDLKGKPQKKYAVDTRRAVVQKQGILRSRPRFDEWRLDFDIVFDKMFFGDWDEKKIHELFVGLLADAGKRNGLGDYRPQRTGWFGIYQPSSNGFGR